MDITQIISAVHQVTGITYEQMKERSRKQEIVNARQWVMYLAPGGPEQIASLFGLDRTTWYHAWKTKRNLLEVDKSQQEEYQQILARLERKAA